MIGKPKYSLDQWVKFTWGKEEFYGQVAVVDKYGVFEDDSDVSYDIYVDSEKCLFKHVREDKVHL